MAKTTPQIPNTPTPKPITPRPIKNNITKQKSSKETTPALCLLEYMQKQDGERTFMDNYYPLLRECGCSDVEIDRLIYKLETEGYIRHIDKDRYWIELTEVGRLFVKRKGRKAFAPHWIMVIELIAAIAGLVAALLSFL